MHKLILATLALIATPLAAQSIDDPLAKAQQEVQTATNLARTADETWCQKTDKTECLVRVHAMKLALRRASYALSILVPTTPVTPPAPDYGVDFAAEGDSITHWSGSYADRFAKASPTLTYQNFAVGGSGVGTPADEGTDKNSLWARLDTVLATRPKNITVLIGANDLVSWQTAQQADPTPWVDDLFGYVAKLRADGIKVALGTILPRCTTDPNLAMFETRRISANKLIRAAAGTKVDAVIDFAADARLDACDPKVFADGLHPTDDTVAQPSGQSFMAEDAAPVLAHMVLGTPLPAPKPTIPVATIQEHVFPEFQKVAPNYARASMLVPAHGTGAIPGTAAPDVLGAFRLICAPSHLSYDDPVVYPGQPGESHLHLFFGNAKADANSTYESLRTSGDPSTCGLLNRSAYWMPALVNGDKVILPDYASVYYKRRPTSDPLCHTDNVECVGLPRGLRYIFGRAMSGGIPSTNKTDPVNFVCTNPSISSRNFGDILAKCQDGAQVGVQIAANNCWDGKNLDSADHRSHMAQMYWNNAGQQVCPAGHKFQSPDFHFNVFWTMREEMRGAKFSSDIQMGKAAGETVHADWFGAWDDETLAAWLTNCIDGFKNASGGDLCDGTQIKGASVPSYGFKNPSPVVPVPAPGTTEIVAP